MTIRSGTVFAGYRIEAEIGRGGMGVVYRAIDIALERPVALKLITPELASEEDFRKRFLRESKLAASLGHPHVLPVYAAGEADGQLYLAMRHVEGYDLKTLLAREGALPPERAIAICGQVAEALDAAHARDLVHRDVKPANVLLDERDQAYLADFGLTKEAGGASTQTGHLVGTLDYLAPEQIRGEEIDGRTDEYALGCMLYECLSGTPPFHRRTEAEVLWAHMQEQPRGLREYPALDPVFVRGLAKDKDERYPTCTDLLDSAREALGFEKPRLRRRRFIHGGRLLLAAGALLLAGGIAATVVELTGGGTGGVSQVAPDSVGLIDAETSRVVGQVPVPGRPSLIAVERPLVWIASAADRTLSAISPDSFSVRRVVAPNIAPSDLAADGTGNVWVLDGNRRVLVKIDSTYGTVARRIKLPPAGFLPEAEHDLARVRIDARAGAVWVTDGATRLLRLDPATGAVRTAVDLHSPLTDVAVGTGAVWAISGAAATLFRISPQGEVRDRIPIVSRTGVTAPFPVAVAVGAGAVWVLNGTTATVTRVDPEAAGVAATIPLGVGRNPSGIAVGDDAVWIANSGDGTLARIDTETNALSSLPVGSSPASVAVAGDRVWVTVQPGFRLKAGIVPAGAEVGSGAGVPALPTSFCSPVFFGGRGKPDYLIASDLPFQSVDALQQTLQMSDAVRFVLAEHGFKAGRYSIGYQSCDDSSAQTSFWTTGTCRRNAKAYARRANLLGVVGTYNSGCSQVEIPILAAAPGGPLATVSPANTYVGLTRAGPGTEPDEPERYYPHGARNFVRVVAADDIQGAADALLAKRLGTSRLYLLNDGSTYGLGIAESVRKVATKLGIGVAGFERWNARARSYTALARRIERARADAVFLGGVIDLNGVALVRGLRAVLGGGFHILTPDGFVPVSLLIQGAGPAAEGVMVSFPGVGPSQLSQAGQRFVAEFEKAVAGRVSPFSIATAEATEVLLDAIGRSDGTRASVTKELFKTRVQDGILGTFSFDRNGDATAGAVTIFRVEKGKETVFAVITPPPSLVRQ